MQDNTRFFVYYNSSKYASFSTLMQSFNHSASAMKIVVKITSA